MTQDYLKIVFRTLADLADVTLIEPGLTDSEVQDVEHRFGFHLPPDLRELLQFGLPVGQRFPNWRNDSEIPMLAWPFEGMCFDVEHNSFWREDWGPKPTEREEWLPIVRRAIDTAPKLVPVFGHRFVSCEPHDAGNPVFSVYQTDIIVYGNNLAHYFHKEFKAPLPEWAASSPRPIRFWTEIVEG